MLCALHKEDQRALSIELGMECFQGEAVLGSPVDKVEAGLFALHKPPVNHGKVEVDLINAARLAQAKVFADRERLDDCRLRRAALLRDLNCLGYLG